MVNSIVPEDQVNPVESLKSWANFDPQKFMGVWDIILEIYEDGNMISNNKKKITTPKPRFPLSNYLSKYWVY